MGRVALRRLALRAFRSFVEPAVIDLPPSGVVLVRGENLDTRGCSGSGKTSLITSIAYAFGCSPVPATQLQSWHTEEKMLVELNMDTDLGPAQLRRGAGAFSLEVGGVVTRGAVAAVEKKLQELHGLSPKFLETMTYRRQKQPGIFLGMENAKKNAFLTRLLSLERFEEEHDKANKAAAELVVRLDTERGSFARLEAELVAMERELEETRYFIQDERPLERAAQEHAEQMAALADFISQEEEKYAQLTYAAERSYESIRGRYEAAKTERLPDIEPDPELAVISTNLALCRQYIQKVAETDRQRKQEYDRAVSAIQLELMSIRHDLATRPLIEAQRAQLEQQLAVLQAATCPTCVRPWDGAAMDAEVARLGAVIQTCMQQLEHLAQRAKREGELVGRLNSMSFVPDAILEKLQSLAQQLETRAAVRAEGQQQRARVVQGEVQVRRLQAAQQEALELAQAATPCQDQYRALQALYERRSALQMTTQEANHRLRVARSENYSARKMLEDRQQRLKALRSKVVGERERLAGIETTLNEERDFAALVGRTGYLGAIFDEILVDISQRATTMMSVMPNVAHCQIQLRSGRTTQEGKQRREINAVILMNGEERPIDACSGGQLTSIDLAVDLAVSSVVAQRTGASPGWLILDESFEGHDQITKEACLELLREVAATENKLVLIIDHAAEMQAMFDQVVTIKFQSGRSSIETSF